MENRIIAGQVIADGAPLGVRNEFVSELIHDMYHITYFRRLPQAPALVFQHFGEVPNGASITFNIHQSSVEGFMVETLDEDGNFSKTFFSFIAVAN